MIKKHRLLAAAVRILFVFVLTACTSTAQQANIPVTALTSTLPPLLATAPLPSTSQPTSTTAATDPSAATTQAPTQAAAETSTVAPTATAPDAVTPAPAGDPQYYSPLQNAQFVSNGATVIIRYGPDLSADQVATLKFSVQGAQSGAHDGQTILADDHKTVIFKPNQLFTPGEQVNVNVSALSLDAQTQFKPLAYTFTVSSGQSSGSPGTTATPTPDQAPAPAFPNYLTVPQDIPHFTISKTTPELASEGYIFVAPFFWTLSTKGSYLLILDNNGNLVYYQSAAKDKVAFDFKKLSTGQLSYFSQQDAAFYLLDSHYQVVNSYTAGNGYIADLHDLQMMQNGNALLMAYDSEKVDMSKFVAGGKKDATVTGLIIQEIDPSKNVVWEWRSWDHIAFTDSTANLTEKNIDLVHGNALELASDGNLLLSSRNLSEITKINLQTGDIIWRFGGSANQFKLVDGQPFAFQHDVRQLPNGDITIFDNQGTEQQPAASHAIEYKLDETNMTATQVWEYTNNPPIFGTYMGDTQRLSGGNTFINWGAPLNSQGYAFITMSEVSADNNVLFQLSFDVPYVSYRAFRFPWQGSPNTLPALVFKSDTNGLTLGYSWNGATDVSSFILYGGNSQQSLNQVDQQKKTAFEMQSHLANLPQGECYFQVAALDQNGSEMARSNVISTDPNACPLNP